MSIPTQPTPLHKQFYDSVKRCVKNDVATMEKFLAIVEEDEDLRTRYSDLYAEAKRVQSLSGSMLVMLAGYSSLISEVNPMMDEFIQKERS